MVAAFYVLMPFTTHGQAHDSGYSGFFDAADRFLKKHVVDGKVNYRLVEKNQSELDKLISTGSALLPAGDAAREKAYWINMYNILVIRSVMDHYPGLESPLRADGFFSDERFRIRDMTYSLDKIEKEVLFPKYPDARLHFVLVCAANGCPPLLAGAYMPDILEEQILAQTVKALNDPEFIRIDTGNESIAISELFKWYKHDYEREKGTLRKFINTYREKSLPAGYKMFYYSYDWDLNDTK